MIDFEVVGKWKKTDYDFGTRGRSRKYDVPSVVDLLSFETVIME